MAEAQKQADVFTQSAAARRMAEARSESRLVLGGIKAIKAAAGDGAPTSILPKEKGETADEYAMRKGRTTLYNVLRGAIDFHTGILFRKPPQLSEDVPPELRKGWWENIDLQGSHGDIFGSKWHWNAEADGIACVLVDKAPAKNGAQQSQEDDERDGRRPYFVLVKAEEILEATPRYVDGHARLARFRRLECTTERDGEWGEKEVRRSRVYYDGLAATEVPPGMAKDDPRRFARFELWEEQADAKGEKKAVRVPDDKGGRGTLAPLTFIPLVPYLTEEVGYFEGSPPLSNLAELNLEHTRKKSDSDNNLHVTQVSRLHRSGWSPPSETGEPGKDPQNQISSYRFLWASEPTAAATLIETNGKPYDCATDDLKKLEERMRDLALQPLKAEGDVTATAEGIRDRKANTLIYRWAVRYKDALELALDYAMQWQGMEDGNGGSVELDESISALMIDSSGYADVLKLRELGCLDDETTLNEAKRYGRISEAVDVKVVLDRLEAEKPKLVGVPMVLPTKGAPGAVPDPAAPPVPPTNEPPAPPAKGAAGAEA